MVSKKEKETKTKLRVKLRAYDHKVIDNGAKQIVEIVARNGGEAIGPIPLPTEIKKYTVNRAAFIYKNSREQFESRTHRRLIDIINPSARVIEALTNMTLPSGISVEVKMM